MADATMPAAHAATRPRAHAAGTAAEDRAGAELRADPASSSTASSSSPPYLSFTDSKLLPDSSVWVGFGNYVRLFEHAELDHGAQQSRHLRLALHRHLHGARPRSRDPARPEDPRRRRAAADLSLPDGALLHRHRRAWKWFLDPGIGLEQAMHAGLDSFSFHWIKDRQDGDLHRRHRRGLAGVGLRHGDVPGRAARHRQRDHQGGADRRRLDLR